MKRQVIAQRLDRNAADILAAIERARQEGIDPASIYVTNRRGDPVISMVIFEHTLSDGSKTYDLQFLL